MPFLVDSIRMELNRMGVGVHLHIHLPMTLTRDNKGLIAGLQRPGQSEDKPTITPMLLEIDRQLEQSELDQIRDNIVNVLQEVTAAVSDWKNICAKLDNVIDNMGNLPGSLQSEKNTESCEFLQWISGNHFTLLGYAYYELKNSSSVQKLVPKRNSFLGINTLDAWKPKAYKLKKC